MVIDFKKVFDSVYYKTMDLKLQIYGTSRKLHNLVMNYLLNRNQHVEIEEKKKHRTLEYLPFSLLSFSIDLFINPSFPFSGKRCILFSVSASSFSYDLPSFLGCFS